MNKGYTLNIKGLLQSVQKPDLYFLKNVPQQTDSLTAAVAQWIRALVPQADGWVFESRPRQT